jgi:hypothetical protein
MNGRDCNEGIDLDLRAPSARIGNHPTKKRLGVQSINFITCPFECTSFTLLHCIVIAIMIIPVTRPPVTKQQQKFHVPATVNGRI